MDFHGFLLSILLTFSNLYFVSILIFIGKTDTAYFLQSVTPSLSLGGEVFWAGQHRKSGIGYAARYNTDKMVTFLGFCATSLYIILIFYFPGFYLLLLHHSNFFVAA